MRLLFVPVCLLQLNYLSSITVVVDELLLVEIRSSVAQENLSDEALKGPSLEAIIQATSNIPTRNAPKVVPSLMECVTDVNIPSRNMGEN